MEDTTLQHKMQLTFNYDQGLLAMFFYQHNTTIYGHIMYLFRRVSLIKEDLNSKCEKCSNRRKFPELGYVIRFIFKWFLAAGRIRG